MKHGGNKPGIRQLKGNSSWKEKAPAGIPRHLHYAISPNLEAVTPGSAELPSHYEPKLNESISAAD